MKFTGQKCHDLAVRLVVATFLTGCTGKSPDEALVARPPPALSKAGLDSLRRPHYFIDVTWLGGRAGTATGISFGFTEDSYEKDYRRRYVAERGRAVNGKVLQDDWITEDRCPALASVIESVPTLPAIVLEIPNMRRKPQVGPMVLRGPAPDSESITISGDGYPKDAAYGRGHISTSIDAGPLIAWFHHSETLLETCWDTKRPEWAFGQ